MGIEEVLTTPRNSWQNAFSERLIGSIRRDCLDHVIVFNDRHLKRLLTGLAVSGQMKLSWNAIDGIMQRAVKPGPERRKAQSPKRIGVDETSAQKPGAPVFGSEIICYPAG
jgi:hypothetical protein